MKRYIYILGLLLAISSTAAASGTEDWSEDGWKTYPYLDGFNGVELRTNANLTLIPGNDFDVRAKGDRRDIEDLDIYVSGQTLVIRRESVFTLMRISDRLEIEVTLPRLSELTNESSGDVRTSSRFESGDLKIVLSGSGDAEIDAVSNTLGCLISGSGDILYQGRTDTMELILSGSGDAIADVTANVVSIKISGSGDAILRGGADVLEVRSTGSGDLRAENLPVRTASVHTNGSGNAEVNVSQTLEAVSGGSGSIDYSGSPGNVDVRQTGSGRITGR